MADAKVSELVTATSLGGSDLLYLVQSNTSKKITAATLFANAANAVLSGKITLGGTPQALGAPGIIDITTPITNLSSDAIGGTLQIPQGTQGQIKVVTLATTAGGSYSLATSNILGNVSITFDSTGDTVVLVYTNNKWAPISSTTGLDLTNISSNIIPSSDSLYNLGAPDKQWNSLYVSNNTIFIGGTPLTVVNGELVIGSGEASANLATVAYVDGAVANAGGGNTGNITFANSTISALNLNDLVVEAKDSDGFATTRLSLEPEFSVAQLSAFSSESTDTFTLANGDFASGVWQDNGFGNGVVSFTGAQAIGDFFQNTLLGLTAQNVSIIINSEPAFTWNGGVSGAGTDTPGFGTNPIVPESPIAITSIQFVYRSQSFISVNYDNQEIRLNAQNAGIRMDADSAIQMFSDQNIELQSGTGFSISSGESINIGTGSSDSVSISTGDFTVSAFDDVSITGRDSFRFRNRSNVAPIRIITDDDNNEYTWAFNANATLSTPGDIVVAGDVTGTASSSILNLVAQPGSNTFIQLNNAVDSSIRTQANLEIHTNGIDNPSIWNFASDGTLYLPGNLSVSSACTSSEINFVPDSSGDGEGYSTIELRPDTSLSENDQYLIIDPTQPTHIHIRAGGTQDDSSADLFLGGENSHFVVYAGQDPAVAITANNSTWAFNVNGTIQFPDSSTQTTAFTSNPTLDFTTTNSLKIEEGVQESYSSIANATGTVVHNCANGHIFYHTTPSSNWTANFTNLELTNGYATSLTLVISQGATGYIANAVLIDNSVTTIKWQGNVEPTPNVNSTDVLSFSLLKTGGNFGDVIVLGQLTTFG